MTQIGSRAHDQLIAGDAVWLVTQVETLLSGEVVVRGETLGRVTASDKVRVLKSGAGDGSEAFNSVAAEDVDATAGDKSITVYNTGEFNINALIFDGADVFADFRDEMRQLNMHGKTSIDVVGVQQP